MDVKMPVYCRIKGKEYFGWTLYSSCKSWTYERIEHKENLIAVGTDMIEQMANLDSRLLDDTFVPQHGSEIHLVPGCPVGVADVRKNYKLKRKADEGTCNVFSPYKGQYGHFWNTGYAIIPSEKAIVLSNRTIYSMDEMDIYQALQHFFPNKWKVNPCPGMPDVDIYAKDLPISYTDLPESWFKLITGQLQKPCISYKKLEFKTDNEVNTDILYLVYKTGKQRFSADAQKAFHIQLCALNEHNWRDYPGTLSILMKDMLYTKYNSSYCYNDLSSKSGLPKAVQEMVRTGMQSDVPFASSKDAQMAQKLIKMVVEIPEDKQFSTIQELAMKFNERKINFNCFYKAFDNIVKFRPKEFKNES